MKIHVLLALALRYGKFQTWLLLNKGGLGRFAILPEGFCILERTKSKTFRNVTLMMIMLISPTFGNFQKLIAPSIFILHECVLHQTASTDRALQE